MSNHNLHSEIILKRSGIAFTIVPKPVRNISALRKAVQHLQQDSGFWKTMDNILLITVGRKKKNVLQAPAVHKGGGEEIKKHFHWLHSAALQMFWHSFTNEKLNPIL